MCSCVCVYGGPWSLTNATPHQAKLLDIQERVAAARRRSHKHGSGSGSGQATPHTTMSTTGTSTVADAAEAKERLQHLRDYQTKDVLDARTLVRAPPCTP